MVDEVSLENGVQGTLFRCRENAALVPDSKPAHWKYPDWTDRAPLLPPCQDCFDEIASSSKCTCDLDADGVREVADQDFLRGFGAGSDSAESNVILFIRELLGLKSAQREWQLSPRVGQPNRSNRQLAARFNRFRRIRFELGSKAGATVRKKWIGIACETLAGDLITMRRDFALTLLEPAWPDQAGAGVGLPITK
jgi:hypothetical protein